MRDSEEQGETMPEARPTAEGPGTAESPRDDVGKPALPQDGREPSPEVPGKDAAAEMPPSVAHQQGKPVAGSANPAAEPEPALMQQTRPADPKDADDVMTHRVPGREAADAAVLARSRAHTRRSFLATVAAAAAGVGLYEYLNRGPQVAMQPGLLEKTYELNAALSRAVFREHALAPTYPLSRAETLRVNGMYGLKRELVAASWRLQLVGMQGEAAHPRFTTDVTAWEYRYTKKVDDEDPGHDTKVDPKMASSAKMAPASAMEEAKEDENHTGRKPRGMGEAGESDSTLPPRTPGLLLTMADIVKLPRRELVTQFKCIEGWSQIVHWAGVRTEDFLEAYPPALIDGKEPKYVYMETPDGDYYTGYDLPVLRHPQSLLVTEMMGAPLTQFHGAPLRLHMPTKYGYKQIKRIGLIAYTSDKPDDYWTKLGYDWYAGL